MRIGGIILAAGESRRMGTPKILLRFEGCPFVEVIANRMREAGIERIVAVVGAGWDQIRDQVYFEGIEWVLNEDYVRGQLSSLWCGLEALGSEDGALMTLVDHPIVEAGTYSHLITEFKKHQQDIVIPTYRGKRGHPAVFGSGLFPKFFEAPLDVGARWVFRSKGVRIREVAVDDPGVRADIDTPEDYGRLVGGSGEG